ncbi:MAG: hypothetical protein IJ275_03955 [Ruminococcus sp.]|nr:hypothetical protein [Ruminococcus sp.]
MKNKKIKASIWQHISFIIMVWMLINTAVCYSGVIFKNVTLSLNYVIEELIFSICHNYRFMITDVFLMDLDPSVQMQQRNFVIEVAVFIVSILLIFLALGLYKSWGKPVAIIFIVLICVNILVSFILIYVPHVLVLLVLQALLIFALGMTVRHINKCSKEKKTK